MKSLIEFKVAETAAEFEAIHALNYLTFVEDIPQHPPNGARRLVDRFHEENRYLIACEGTELIGMLALRAQRPFSLDAKLPDLDAHLPPGRRWGEVRLLAVKRDRRGSGVLAGLLRLLEREFERGSLDAAVVSATTLQKRLYAHLGFKAFGPLVGRDGAWYQPMYLQMERYRESLHPRFLRSPVNLLPGPVALPDAVRRAFRGEPRSHRSPAFLDEVRSCRASLCRMTGAPHAALMPGGGTMANEVVCAQLGMLEKPGLVVSHGEFGERLADHARRARLPHYHWQVPWGEALDFPALERWLEAHPETGWLWAAHCETSTGAVTSLDTLRALCAPRGIRLCLDCVSSLGVVPVELRGVHLASSTSGKGLASVPGIGIVFHDTAIAPVPDRIPRVLDLGLYATAEGMPFTLNSNLVAALEAALGRTDWPAKYARVAGLGLRLRNELIARGFVLVDPSAVAVLTLEVPAGVSSVAVADALEPLGWLTAARSQYLQERGWLQLCLMGEVAATDLDGLGEALVSTVFRRL